jgi:general secretion pathway protein H
VLPISRARPVNGDAQHRSAEAGVILLDIVLTLAVFALLVLLALPHLPYNSTTPSRQGAYAAEIAAVLKTDRTAAARQGREVATRVDVATRRVSSGATGTSVTLPQDITLDVIASDICTVEPGRFAIAFSPDGRSCGAVIRIAKGDRDWRIRVNWLTGFIDVVAPNRG